MKRRILVVDDEPELLFSLETLLIEAGFEVVTAENGEEALLTLSMDAAKGSSFELALLDIQMPGIDGIELLRRMRDAFPEIRTLVFSGSEQRKKLAELEQVGNPVFLDKPFDERKLFDKINNVLMAGHGEGAHG